MKKRFWIIAALLTVAVLVFAVLLARPGYRWAKSVRAQMLSSQSQELVASGELEQAFQKALSAHYLAPLNEDLKLQVARVALKKRDAETWRWYREAIDHRDRTPEELKELALLLREQEQYSILRQLLPRALQELPNDPELRVAQIDMLQRDRRFGTVDALASSLTPGGSQDPSVHSVYVQSLLRDEDPESRQRAIEHLKELSRADSDLGLAALRSLLTLEDTSKEDRIRYAERLRQHQLATARDRLLAVQAKIQASGESVDEHWNEIVDIVDTSTDEGMNALSAWLLQQRAWERILSLIPQERAQKDEDLQMMRVRALLETGKAAEVFEISMQNSDVNPLRPVINFIIRGRALEAMNRPQEARDVQKLMVDTAELPDFPLVEQELFRTQNWDLLVQLYERTLTNPQTRQFGQERLLRAYYHLGREEDLRKVLAEIEPQSFANDPEARNFVCYLQFLLGENVEDARLHVEELIARYPGVSDFRLSLAFFFVMLNQVDQARQLAGPMNEFPANAPRYLRLIVTILSSTDGDQMNRSQGEGMLWDLSHENLLPSEKRLLHRVRELAKGTALQPQEA